MNYCMPSVENADELEEVVPPESPAACLVESKSQNGEVHVAVHEDGDWKRDAEGRIKTIVLAKYPTAFNDRHTKTIKYFSNRAYRLNRFINKHLRNVSLHEMCEPKMSPAELSEAMLALRHVQNALLDCQEDLLQAMRAQTR